MMGRSLPKLGIVHSVRRGPVTTTQLVMYAGASGDFNRIHYDHPFAVAAGLPGVLGHGMLTMAFAASCVAEAVGPSCWISRITARFTAPVRVGDTVEVTATVMEGDTPEAPLEVDFEATAAGKVVLRGAAVVQIAASARAKIAVTAP